MYMKKEWVLLCMVAAKYGFDPADSAYPVS